MKHAAIALLAMVATMSSIEYKPAPSGYYMARFDDRLTIYELAEAVTGAPADIIEGIAWAESSGGANLNHPDPLDVGYFGLHETPEYHAERAAKWGEYDARNPVQAAIITGRLYVENLERLGDEEKAIAAHYQGVRGVRRNGPARWYIERVKSHA